MQSFDRLVDIMARLRGPGGCPWDRAQDHQSLRPYLLEECAEVLDALDAADMDALADELGDLLLQIVFHAQLAAESGAFDLAEVCTRIGDKLIRRHPHVFAAHAPVDGPEAVVDLWQQIKREERGGAARSSALDGTPRALPALARAQDLQERAARVGFDWPDQTGRLAKLAEELAELSAAAESGDQAAIDEEFGDILIGLVNAARGLGVDAEASLRAANAKLERRFRACEALAGGAEAFAQLDLSAKDALWDRVKAGERA
ncbi:MAG TPA: nucleoside triphosphate pyrophosphohydrolase [Armatimonadetes bacterium]|nr:nucleoside triphosphate pyrophosphohydrolase [Armatimonadota bacterium]